MKSSDPNDESLEGLVKLMCEEVMAKSTQELLEQAKEEHDDLKAHVNGLRKAMDARIAAAKKARLRLARQELDEEQARPLGKLSIPLSKLKAKVQRLIETRADIPQRLTLAFRSGAELTDEDWESIAEDLSALGFLDEPNKEA